MKKINKKNNSEVMESTLKESMWPFDQDYLPIIAYHPIPRDIETVISQNLPLSSQITPQYLIEKIVDLVLEGGCNTARTCNYDNVRIYFN